MLAALVVIVVSLVVLLIVKSERNRANEESMAELRKMNRGKIDQSGWTKKPWQHDASEAQAEKE